MTAPIWIQRIQQNKKIADRKKFWDRIIPQTKLVYFEQESGVLGLHIETFQLLESETFEGIRVLTDSIKTALGTSNACVCPVGLVMDSGDEKLGTISRQGFRIVWSESVELPSIFSEKLSQHERDFITRLDLIPKLTEDSVIGYCPLLHARMVTKSNADSKVITVSLVSQSGAKIKDFQRIKQYIKNKYNAKLVEFSNDGEFDSSMMVSIIISAKDEISPDQTSFIETGTIPVARAIKSAKKLATKEV